MSKPIIAVTMGDAAGIGPELIVKILTHGNAREICRPVIIGSPEIIEDAARITGAKIRINTVQETAQARFELPYLDVLCPEDVNIKNISHGKLSPETGKAAALCLKKAFELAEENKIQGIVSAPLNKEAFHMVGYEYSDELKGWKRCL